MLRNYLKIAWRNLWRNKGYMFINVGGLMTGLACCLLIALYVFDELSYESWNPDAERTFRINSDIRFGGGEFHMALSADPMGPTLQKDYPVVEAYTRLRGTGNWVVKSNENQYVENNVLYADSSLFNVFPLKILAGSRQHALNGTRTLAMNKTTALKYFKSPDAAIGQSLLLDNKHTYRVTAVFDDIPANSHLRCNIFLAMADNKNSRENNWGSHNFSTYLLLKKGTDPAQFNRIFSEIRDTYLAPDVKKVLGVSMAQLEKEGNYMRYSIMPVRDIHLHSSRVGEMSANSSIQYVYIFSAIALFILLIACINFMNLATAQSSGRAREVGIRKVLGSERSSLIARFLSESTITVLLALLLALVVVALTLPAFSKLADKQLAINSLLNWRFVVLAAVIPLVVGLVAGSYPAFFLSAFQPILVLKGTIRNKMGGARLRSVLVVVQFTMSIILLTGTIVIYKQLNYIQNKQLGFDKEQVLIVQNSFTLSKQQANALKQELQRLPGVEAVSVSGFLPVPSGRNDSPFFTSPDKASENTVSMQNWYVDYDYLRTMKMELVQGRFFSPDFPTDSNGMVINETAAKMFHLKDPIGQRIYHLLDNEGKNMASSQIIGVVRNFHFENMRQSIGPLCFVMDRSTTETAPNILVRSTASAAKQALVKQVENKWKAFSPGQPFTYSFMDNDFNNMYKADEKVGKIVLLFAVLAIMIACLGLFGLVAYVVEQRTKEIGIRKVLGASIGNVVTLLSKDFVRLVLIAIILATPLAWYLMQQWLQDYEYRIHMQWWMFVGAGGIAVLIALATVSLQSVKAALINPVRSLKSE